MRRQRRRAELRSPVNDLETPQVALRSGTLLIDSGEHVGRALIVLCAILFVVWLGRVLRQQGVPPINAFGASTLIVALGVAGARTADAWVAGGWQGAGYSAAGAVLAAPVAIAVAARLAGKGMRRLADLAVVPGLTVLAIARLGCLADGCDYGRPTTMGWGVRYIGEAAIERRFQAEGLIAESATISPALHAFPLYESLGLLALLSAIAVFRKVSRLHDGALAAVAALGWGVVRVVSERYRGNIDPGTLAPGAAIGTAVACAGALALVWLRYGPTSTGSSDRADQAQNEPG